MVDDPGLPVETDVDEFRCDGLVVLALLDGGVVYYQEADFILGFV